MTIEEAKRELDEVRNAIREFENLKAEYEALQARMTISSVPINERVTGGIKKDLGDDIARFVELEEAIRTRLKQINESYHHVEMRIQALDDVRYKYILTSYYLKGWTCAVIADRVGCSKSYVHTMKREGLLAYAKI